MIDTNDLFKTLRGTMILQHHILALIESETGIRNMTKKDRNLIIRQVLGEVKHLQKFAGVLETPSRTSK